MLGRGLRWVGAQLAFLAVLAVHGVAFGYLLVVRSRLFDVAVLLVLGISIEVLAAVIPRP